MEEKKARTLADITKEYSEHATQVGDKSYKIACFPLEIIEHHKAMGALQQEARTLAPPAPIHAIQEEGKA